MTPTLRVTLDMDDRVVGPLLSLLVSSAFAVGMFVAGLYIFDTDSWLAIGSGMGFFALLVAHGRAPWAAIPALLDLRRLRRLLATPDGHAALLRATRNVALDHIDTLPPADLRGTKVTVEVDWTCRKADIYPMLIRLTMEDGGSHAARRGFVEGQADHVLSWDTLGLTNMRDKPFTLRATVGPLPIGNTGHARFHRAHLRTI